MEKPVFLLLAWALGLIAGGFAAAWVGMHSRNGKWAAVLTAVLLAEVMLIHLLPSLLNVKLPEYTKLISELLPKVLAIQRAIGR